MKLWNWHGVLACSPSFPQEKPETGAGVRQASVVPTSEEAEKLADLYVAEGIITERYVTDGVHIATAAVNDLDFIVSFNFQHIVKRKTIILTEAVNLREGYRRVGIFSPTEVIENVE